MSINVRLGRTKVNWFEVKVGWDHGLYTEQKDYEKEVRESFKLVKIIEF